MFSNLRMHMCVWKRIALPRISIATTLTNTLHSSAFCSPPNHLRCIGAAANNKFAPHVLTQRSGLCSSRKLFDDDNDIKQFELVFGSDSRTRTFWRKVCSDSNPRTIAFLNKHWYTIEDKIAWSRLSSNPAAVPLLDKHWDKIQDKIDWACLGVCNENVIPLLDKHFEELKQSGAIDYFWCNSNPCVILWLKRHYGVDDDIRAEK